jgi:16S rRNA (uracil1498-N3)-methyltransferase
VGRAAPHETGRVSLPRFHLPAAHTGVLLSLPADAAHHAFHVLRLRSGARIRAFDGRGRDYEATIESANARSVLARIGDVTTAAVESPLRITLAFAPLSADLASFVIQKAVELGVANLCPLLSARTEPAGRAILAPARIERLARIAISAAAQCGRAFVPEVSPLSFDELLSTPVDGPRLLCCERAAAKPFPELSARPSEVLLAIGPAGGWEDLEIERAGAADFSLVGLGPRILRAETAAFTAVAVAQLKWGDLAASPSEDWRGQRFSVTPVDPSRTKR